MNLVITQYPVLTWLDENGIVRRVGYRLLTKALIEKYGVCYWCGIKVRQYTEQFRKGMKVPDDMATIDHIVSRYHRKKGEVSPKVLACNHCNQKRSKAEDKIYKKSKNKVCLK